MHLYGVMKPHMCKVSYCQILGCRQSPFHCDKDDGEPNSAYGEIHCFLQILFHGGRPPRLVFGGPTNLDNMYAYPGPVLVLPNELATRKCACSVCTG